VLVLHDWFCDHSTWDPVLPYLTPDRFTYVFADLRGYGASREIAGTYSIDEAAQDTIAIADRLGWPQFALVGHSMSCLIVQRIMQLVPDRVSRVVAVTPVGPAGMGADEATVGVFRSLALADDETRFATLSRMWGTRLSETWIRYKLRRWRETASPAAAAEYVKLWATTDISAGARGLRTPMLIVAAAQDAPPFQAAALKQSVMPYYPNARLISLGESGHYPMQEQPPLLATEIERFLFSSSALA
jgi:pimeloyl-ACP methyl ester carboxylesterase